MTQLHEKPIHLDHARRKSATEVPIPQTADIHGHHLGAITPLIRAAAVGNRLQMQLLLSVGADVNAIDPKYGANALFWAARNGHLDAVAFLLDRGVDANSRAQDGKMPLIWASITGQF